MEPYDLSILQQLDDNQQVLEILDLFLVNAPLQVRDLLEAAAHKDWTKTYAVAHKLKGSLGVLGAFDLMALLQQMEKQAEAAKTTGVEEDTLNGTLQKFIIAFSELETLLKKERNK
ncbi:MAG TPA: Hpt domain-containing protein [Puia sp.]|jgi:HPt (histidine-containing phosphotransfer) domain-containing protein|nr:Hpt domain-containing protein [Puia sp.]